MRKMLYWLLPLISASALVTGCYSHHAAMRQPPTVLYPTGEIIVTEPPPEPRREVVTSPPDAEHVWTPGYWMFTNSRWVWIPGHWESRPRPQAVWTPGHWDKDPSGRGWVWIQGRWD